MMTAFTQETAAFLRTISLSLSPFVLTPIISSLDCVMCCESYIHTKAETVDFCYLFIYLFSQLKDIFNYLISHY